MQLEVRTPVAPAAFTAGGHVLLVYELHLASEGLPYVIDRFRMKRPEATWLERRNEFPLGDATIDFDMR